VEIAANDRIEPKSESHLGAQDACAGKPKKKGDDSVHLNPTSSRPADLLFGVISR
jgi:hypothetical protein